MPSTYSEVFYHVIWSTREREPLITPEVEARLYPFLRQKCSELGVHLHALGGIDDHLHLAITIPPRLAVAHVVHDLKGAASYFINHRSPSGPRLYWQEGYGVLTVSRRELPRVVAYVENQRTHHAEGSLSHSMERATGDTDRAPREGNPARSPGGASLP